MSGRIMLGALNAIAQSALISFDPGRGIELTSTARSEKKDFWRRVKSGAGEPTEVARLRQAAQSERTGMQYHERLAFVETSIHLPHKPLVFPLPDIKIESEQCLMPFESIRFVETFSGEDEEGIRYAGTEEMILWEEDDQLYCCSRLSYPSVFAGQKKPLVLYSPEDKYARSFQPFIALARFNEMLRRKDLSFVERPMSRQVKRYEGFASAHSEYIILRKDEPQYHFGMPIRRMIPALRQRHKVRKHFRRFWKGVELQRPIAVRGHERNVASSREEAVPKVYVVR